MGLMKKVYTEISAGQFHSWAWLEAVDKTSLIARLHRRSKKEYQDEEEESQETEGEVSPVDPRYLDPDVLL